MSAITAEHMATTCKPGQGEVSCSYLIIHDAQFKCAKTATNMEDVMVSILFRRLHGEMTAMGDNCLGWQG